jgi:hypothetical protein
MRCCCVQVVNNVDTRLRGMIAAAKLYDEKKDDYNYTMPLTTIMAMHASVMQGAATTAVAELASAVAANATLDPTDLLTKLAQVLLEAAMLHTHLSGLQERAIDFNTLRGHILDPKLLSCYTQLSFSCVALIAVCTSSFAATQATEICFVLAGVQRRCAHSQVQRYWPHTVQGLQQPQSQW